MPTTEPGLRDRKKAATRTALSQAAMRLAMEHGVAKVTAEAIAAAADVSPRTFHNYFSSKEEAIVAVVADGARELADALRARPADEPVWDSLQHVLTDSVSQAADAQETFFAQITLIHDNVGLLHEHLAALDEMRVTFSEIIAERTGTDAERDMYPHLQAGTVAICMKVATDAWWSAGAGGADLTELIAQAFAQVRAGLPQPRSAAGISPP